MHESTPFDNTDPVNGIEFFPPKDGGVPRASSFLQRSLPANFSFGVYEGASLIVPYLLLFRGSALPDRRVFIAATNRTVIYDVETNT
jgi:hypothetical protein